MASESKGVSVCVWGGGGGGGGGDGKREGKMERVRNWVRGGETGGR